MGLAKLSIDLEARLTNLQSDMDKAVRLAEKDAARMERAFTGVRAAAGAIGTALAGALSVGAFTAWVKGSIDAADAAIKQAQSVGLLVEDLTALQFAADLSGVSQEELGTALTRLARTAKDAGDGVKASAEAFDQLGVKVTNADGTLKSQNQLLDELADRFAALPDGVTKTALATEVFGSAGTKLIPLLAGGSEGLRAMKQEAEALGLVIGTSTAKEAEKLNDNITRLQKRLEGVANSIAAVVVPQLDELVERVLAALKSFDSFADFLSSGVLAGNNFSDVGQGVEFFTKQVAALKAERAGLGQKGGFFDAIRVGQLKGEIAEAEKLLEFYQRVASATGQLGAGGGRGFINPPGIAAPAAPPPAPPRASGSGRASRAAPSAPIATDTLLIYQADQLREAFELIEKINAEAERAAASAAPTTDTLLIYQADELRAAFEAIEQVNTEAERGLGVVNNAAKELGLSFSSAFEDAIVSGKGLRELLQGLEQDIIRIVTRQLVTQPLADGITGLLGGGGGGGGGDLISTIGSFLSSFGGFFADGGYLGPGQVGVAGERGPELIFGGRTGVTVQPNGGRGGGGLTVYNNFTLAGTPDRRTLQQVYAAAARGVERASSRNN